MKKTVLFIWLFKYALLKYLFGAKKREPAGLRGEDLFIFLEPGKWDRPHGVVAFALPKGESPDNYSSDLWGPFGFTSNIDWNGLHLYGRDTWGVANQRQIAFNPRLREIARKNPGKTILLAGVRGAGKRYLFPLNNARRFILVRK